MRIVGIVAEYNPFHRGHEYQLAKARELSKADAVVVCMSGNWVQRGEPACVDKWTRAKWAIRGGADLVVELPTYFALSDAGGFARGGVITLKQLGIDTISFGSENGDSKTLETVSKRILNCDDDIHSIFRKNPGISYPAAREQAYIERYGKSENIDSELKVLSSSNDILAIEYLKHLDSVEIVPIQRLGAEYNSEFDSKFEFQSATAIRKLMENNTDFDDFVPDYVNDCMGEFKKAGTIKSEYFKLAQYKIVSTSASDIDKMPSGGEGLGARLKAAAMKAKDLDELIINTKSKKHTYTRVSRLIAQLVLGIDRSEYQENPQYIRVLAFNEKGRQVLSDAKKNAGIQIVTNVNKALNIMNKTDQETNMLMLDIHASNVYNIMAQKNIAENSDYIKMPIIK